MWTGPDNVDPPFSMGDPPFSVGLHVDCSNVKPLQMRSVWSRCGAFGDVGRSSSFVNMAIVASTCRRYVQFVCYVTLLWMSNSVSVIR